MVFHAHIIIIQSVVHKSLLFRNEEKLVSLLVYSSFIRVATSGFTDNSVFTGSNICLQKSGETSRNTSLLLV